MKKFFCPGIAILLSLIAIGSAFADDFTWDSVPGSGDWNTAGNWTPDVVPNGPADRANFLTSTITAISISADTEVESIGFASPGNSYTFTINPARTFTLSGRGIFFNNSGLTQNFVTAVDGAGNRGQIFFTNNATADHQTAFTNNGGALVDFVGGRTTFFDSSHAGSAAFTNNGGTVSGSRGGFTEFFGLSTAEGATFINNPGAVSNAGGGFTIISDGATAGSAAFTNNAATTAGAGAGITTFDSGANAGQGMFVNNGSAGVGLASGRTEFFDSSTADMATITNNGASGGGFGGGTTFRDSSLAGNALITNKAVDGSTLFGNTASADHSTILNEGSSVAGSGVGNTFFTEGSNAGSAMITNSGGTTVSGAFGGFIVFTSGASASNATIVNEGGTAAGASGGRTSFTNGTTAGFAHITNNGGTTFDAEGGHTNFSDESTAANSTITNDPGTPGFEGSTNFFSTSTAANAMITSNAGAGVFFFGGQTNFSDSSTAANATIIANGSSVLDGFGSGTNFRDMSTAGAATLIANGGTNGGEGGRIIFDDDSTGGTSRVEVFGTGELNISFHNAPGVTIGSIEGDGNVFLGNRNLTVGGNNLSTIFSGVMQDGGSVPANTGGSLTKIGTGTLVMSGANTYTGDTNINDGVLQIDGSITSNTFVNPDGTLAGTGTIFGNLESHGVVSPGHSPGTLTVQQNYTNYSDGTFRAEIGGLTEGVNSDLLHVGHDAFINGGTLEMIRFGNFRAAVGDRVTILRTDVLCTRTGTFDDEVRVGWGLIQPFADYSNQQTVDVVFLLSQTFGSQGVTPNQKAVGHGLDHAVSDNCVPEVTTFVGNITQLEALPFVYDLIAPEELASIYEIGFSQAMVHNDNLIRRMDDIRAGSNGYCGPVVQTTMVDNNPPISDKNVAIPDKNVVMDKNVAPAFVPCPENHWGIFATGTGDFVNVDGDDNAHGYDIDTGSFIAGVDYRIGNHFAIGIDGGYASSRADLVNHGHIDVDGGKIGGYATVYGFRFLGGNIHLDGGVNGGWNNYDTRRTGLSESFPEGEGVNGDTNGSEFNAFISYGTDYNFGCLTIGTWSTIQYTDVSIDSFTEEGSLAPLHIQDQDQDSFRGTTGIRASYDIRFGHCGIIRPEIRAAWQHESSDRSYAIDANFIDCHDTFTVHGPKIGRDSALVGAALHVQWCARFASYVNYDGVLGRENYTNNAVSGGFRFGF